MPPSYAARRERLRERLVSLDADAALVTGLVNVRYLTGFTGSHAALLVAASGGDEIATDGRYAVQAAAEAPDLEVVVHREVAPTLAGRAGERAVRRLAFEAHHVTVDAYDELRAAAPGVELVRLGHVVEELRTVKDDAELALLETACRISDAAFEALLDVLGPGLTERHVARALESQLLDIGADGAAFPSIVASGPAGALPHHAPDERVLGRGDLVIVDFGAQVGGYRADMTRTVVLGRAQDWQRELYDLVSQAQRAGLGALAPGADPREVDATARRVVEAAGHGERFGHPLGHGVGLEIHESPLLGATSTAGRLRSGTSVTVEPGVYLPGRGGVRIEDTVVVRPSGAEPLTTTSKDLLVL